jgi:hypothetical protein
MFTDSHAADPGTARPAVRQRIELRTDARATRAGPLDGRLRVLRVVALGGASMLLAAGAHLAAGGRLPSPGILVVTTFLVGLTAVTLTARRCRFGLLAIGLGVEQLILHEVFAASSMAWAPALHAAGGHDATTGHMVVTDVPAGMATSPVMAAGHLVATLATVWLLAHGEDWLWGLGERAIRAAAAAPTPRRRRSPQPRGSARPVMIARLRRGAVEARGPPRLAWSIRAV